jgi:hypothetical protein
MSLKYQYQNIDAIEAGRKVNLVPFSVEKPSQVCHCFIEIWRERGDFLTYGALCHTLSVSILSTKVRKNYILFIRKLHMKSLAPVAYSKSSPLAFS